MDKVLELAELRRALELARASNLELQTQRDEALAAASKLAASNTSLTTRLERAKTTIRKLKHALYGRKSERLTREELEELGQVMFEFAGIEARDAAGRPLIPVPPVEDIVPQDAPRPEPKQRRTRRRTMSLSDDIERVVTPVSVPAAERNCCHCGHEMTTFDFVEHQVIEVEPAKVVVHVQKREKLACKHRGCKGEAVTAERPSVPDSSLRVGTSVLVHLLEAKCDDALPIHRQCDQFRRMGFDMPEETAYGYWRHATTLLVPVAEALVGVILEDPDWVGVDDTGLNVLDKTRKGGKFRGHLWCLRAASGLVAFQFTETWEAEEIAPWFAMLGPQTYVQVDDYKGYSAKVMTPSGQVVEVVPTDRRLGCMMHVRRRFYEAFTLGDKRAAPAVAWIKQLYEIEAQGSGKPPEQRHALRQEHSIPLLDAFDAWVDEQLPLIGKTGKLAEALRYAKQQRGFVRRCFSDGRFEIDNGACERSIREPAIGRKNFLFTGSVDAAHRLAAAYTLVQSCRNLGLNTREYLTDVLDKIQAGWPARRLTELLPHRWAESRAT